MYHCGVHGCVLTGHPVGQHDVCRPALPLDCDLSADRKASYGGNGGNGRAQLVVSAPFFEHATK